MPIYDVYVICDQCCQPHSVHVNLSLADENLDKTRLAEYYIGKPLPSQIVFMQSNKYRCPHTKQLFPADNIENAVFFAHR